MVALHARAQVYPHGSTDALPYCTMGSGSLNAMAVFEDGYKEDLSREEVLVLAMLPCCTIAELPELRMRECLIS